jgi:hypothetical protein
MIRLRFAAELTADRGEPAPTPESPPKTLPIRSEPPAPLDHFNFDVPGSDRTVKVMRFGPEAVGWARRTHPGQWRLDPQGGVMVVRFFEPAR